MSSPLPGQTRDVDVLLSRRSQFGNETGTLPSGEFEDGAPVSETTPPRHQVRPDPSHGGELLLPAACCHLLAACSLLRLPGRRRHW